MSPPAPGFDRYEILGHLGEGGMGSVFKARAVGPHGFEKIVALKRIRPRWARDAGMTERFVNEARIAARLHHANIVQVFDFGRHGDELFLVMEWVDGPSLEVVLDALRRRGEWPSLSQAMQITTDVARALDSAHRTRDEDEERVGVIHKDVSPANILVSREGVVKLADFGIADWARRDRAATIEGKPRYMAPEQVRGDTIDLRADLFSLGVVLHELLTRDAPWPQGIGDVASTATLESLGWEPPSRRVPGVPPELDAVVERLLSPSPDARYASAGEVVQALLSVSYARQIVLDPLALRPLVPEATAPPQVEGDPVPRLFVASERTAAGTTLVPSEPSGDTRAPGEARVTVAPRARPARRRGALLAVAAVTVLLAAGALLAWQADGPRAAPRHGRPPAPAAPRPSEGEARERAAPQPQERVAAPAPREVVAAPAPREVAAAPAPREEAAAPPPRVRQGAPAAPTAHAEAPHPGPLPASRGEGENTPPAALATAHEEVPAATGQLSIWTDGWAEVWIDGTKLAHTAPVRGLTIAAGRHRVRLVNPILGREAERVVDVAPGGSSNLHVELE